MRAFSMIKEAIGSMRYESGFNKYLYWFIRIGSIVLVALILLVIAGVVYCKINGIDIQFFA